jgi:hypothetical protein
VSTTATRTRTPRRSHYLIPVCYQLAPIWVLERGRIGARDVPALDELRAIGERSVRLSECSVCGLLCGEWWERIVDDTGRTQSVFAVAVGLEVEALAVCTSMPPCSPLHLAAEPHTGQRPALAAGQ